MADTMNTARRSRWLRLRRPSRLGTAAVQLAIVAPVMFTFFFGAIEFSRVNQVVNATALAAYSGCRRAIVPGATAANATTAAQASLSASLVNGTVTISPSTITNATTTVTVTVAVALNSNSWTTPIFTNGMTITRACTLTREKTN